jgi:mono/diheme cytochrome c family protein
MKIISIISFAIAAIILVVLFFVYSGKYNVSAQKKHYKITEWLLNTTIDRSIKEHAKNIKVPDLSKPSIIKMGFIQYKEMCIDCHGAPGIQPSELAEGLNPKAKLLTLKPLEWKPQELFWIIKYGIRMTGMPAWGITHSDQKIWTIVAFLNKLPNLSVKEYNEMSIAFNSDSNFSK